MVGHSGTRSPRLRFHAVTVLAGADACPQAQSVRNLRLLSAEAPRLPMVGCDRPDRCKCRFKHHDDRRAGPRRRVDRPIDPRAATTERRTVLGRRTTDWPDD